MCPKNQHVVRTDTQGLSHLYDVTCRLTLPAMLILFYLSVDNNKLSDKGDSKGADFIVIVKCL